MRTETPVGYGWDCQKWEIAREMWVTAASDSAFRGWLRIKWIKMNSPWRKLLLSILWRDSGVTGLVVDVESWRTKMGWQNPACDLYMPKLGVSGTIRNKADFFNAHLWRNLKKTSAFARGHENLLPGKGNQTTYYFSFIVFCHHVLHGEPQFPKCRDLTSLLTHF